MTVSPLTNRIPFLGLGRAAYVFLALGALAIAADGLAGTGPVADVLFFAISFAASAAVFLRVWRTRPATARAWNAIAFALALLALADLLVIVGRDDRFASARDFANLLYLAAYAPLFLAAFWFGRGAHSADRTVFIDTAVIGLAAVPLAWTFVLAPNLPREVDGLSTLAAVALPLLDVFLVTLVIPLVAVRFTRSPSAMLLTAGLVVLSLGDTYYALQSLHPEWPDSNLTSLAWLGTYVLLGAAALVPSAMRLGVARDPHPASGDSTRLAVLAVALVSSPVLLLGHAIADRDPNLIPFALLALATACLVTVRLRRTIGQLEAVDLRFRRFMGHPGVLAVIKDRAGRYTYRNAAALRVAYMDPDGWYGATDRELFPAPLAAERMAADEAVRATGTPITSTFESDGTIWHTERFLLPGSSADVGVVGLDITDRVHAEQKLEFQARLLESVRDAVIVVDVAGRVTYWNDGAAEILGYGEQEMLGRSMQALVPTGAMETTDTLWAAVLGGKTESVEWEGRRRDGRPVWLDVHVSPLLGDDGSASAFLGVAKDITDRKQAELELARLGTAIEHATDGVIVTDAEHRIVYVNPAFEQITGYAGHEVRDRPAGEIPELAAYVQIPTHARNRGPAWRGDIVGLRRDGTDLICETTISPIADEGPDARGFVTILRDVTSNRAAERAADRRARERSLMAETLASLHTGQTPEDTAQAICDHMVKLPETAIGTVVTFDVDGGATVIGQATRIGIGEPGRALTQERSRYLRERAAAGPWVERWPADPSHPYTPMFERLGIQAHAYAPILVEKALLGVLISGSDLDDAVERMSERLPALVEFAAITATLLGGAVADRNAAATALARIRSAIEREAFRPVFQPIVELATGKTLGYEALTRFDDGTPPNVWFDEAHKYGAGLELECASLHAAFEAAERLPAGPWLNINVSPQVILAELVEALLPIASRDVVLEITEHEAINDYESFRAAVAPFRDRVRIAVDDAGAGFASLRHVVELDPAMVKLDRSLVAGIGADPARQAVVSGMVRFTQAAGIVLLAEGIETEEDLVALRELGVTLGQGYLLGEPGPADGPIPGAPPSKPTKSTKPSRPSARTRRPSSRGAPPIEPVVSGT